MPFGQSEVCPIPLMGFPDHMGKGNIADLTTAILTAEQGLRGLNSLVECEHLERGVQMSEIDCHVPVT